MALYIHGNADTSQDPGTVGFILVTSLQGTREYNVGDAPDIAAQSAAQQMGIALPRDFQARQINPERDIVQFDIVLVMDKFTAADVLREVCAARYHPFRSASKMPLCACIACLCSSKQQPVTTFDQVTSGHIYGLLKPVQTKLCGGCYHSC